MAPARYLDEGLTNLEDTDYREKTFWGGSHLSSRISKFVLIGIFSMVALGGMNLLAHSKVSTAARQLAAAHKLVELTEGIEKAYWQIRGEEKGFLLSNNAEHVKRYETVITSVADDLDTLYNHPGAAAVRDQVTTINEGLAQYANEFRSVVQAEKMLGAARKGDVIFVAPKSSGEGPAKLSREDIARLKSLTKTADAMMKQEARTLRLDEIFAYMVPSIESLVAFARDRLRAITQEEQDARSMVRLVLPLSGVAILMLFMLFGLFLLRSIIVPVRAIAIAARRVTEGDDDVVIPAQGNSDEMGDLARTLNALRSGFVESELFREELQSAKEEVERLTAQLQRAKDLAAAGESINAGANATGAGLAVDDGTAGKMTSEHISAISQLVARSSQSVSAAAFEAERTGALIKGLAHASAKIDEVEDLLDAIATRLPPGDDPVSAKFSGVRETTDEATLALRDLGASVNRVKQLAMEIADSSSSQALETTADLLQRSEDLRGMLDDLVSRIRTPASGSSSS